MTQKTALIVDDSATARIMLARVLSKMDVLVKQAKSGEEALNMLVGERPDLIFLDHLMPGMDGFQTLKALKSNPATWDIPVIMYTSQNALRYQEEAKVLGAVGVVTKQFDREQLYLMVERIWMQHEIAANTPVTEDAWDDPALVAASNKVVHLHPAGTPSLRQKATLDPLQPVTAGQSGTTGDSHPETDAPDTPVPGFWQQRFRSIMILILALFSLYAIYAIQLQRTQIDSIAEQLEASRHVMQEVISILERYQ